MDPWMFSLGPFKGEVHSLRKAVDAASVLDLGSSRGPLGSRSFSLFVSSLPTLKVCCSNFVYSIAILLQVFYLGIVTCGFCVLQIDWIDANLGTVQNVRGRALGPRGYIYIPRFDERQFITEYSKVFKKASLGTIHGYCVQISSTDYHHQLIFGRLMLCFQNDHLVPLAHSVLPAHVQVNI